jgi:type IV pilus assembly protein PilB
MGVEFSDLLIELGYVTSRQIEEALLRQKRGAAPIGQIMVHLAMLTQAQVEETLNYQLSRNGDAQPFGMTAVTLGFIGASQLEEAVAYQKSSVGVLGDVLIKMGYLTTKQRDEVLMFQMQ